MYNYCQFIIIFQIDLLLIKKNKTVYYCYIFVILYHSNNIWLKK